MKAITQDRYGQSDVLQVEDIQRPEPGDTEVLVRVNYTTITRTDCGSIPGKPYAIRLFIGLFKPSSRVPGTDFAGEVIEIGKDVQQFDVGDRVWGFNDEGSASFAEYMIINEKKAIARIPDMVSYDQAVACAEGAHYAYNFVNKVHLRKGDKVLVNGATGAIGSATLQILKSMEVTVTAVGNTKNIELLKTLGADKIYNYERTLKISIYL